MRAFLLLASLIATTFAHAQGDSAVSRTRIHYYNQFVSGGLFGKKGQGTNFSAQMIHGVRLSRAAFGLGVGYDAYMDWKIVPLFAAASFDLVGAERGKLFLQVTGGMLKGRRVERDVEFFRYVFDTGHEWSPQIGYRVENRPWSIYFMVGYQWQRFSYREGYTWLISPDNYSTVERKAGRFTASIGVGLH